MEDYLTQFINTDRDTNIALLKLKYYVLGDDVDESELGEEVLKLRTSMRKRNVKSFNVSLNPDFRGNEEDIARQMNQIEDQLSDPVQNFISRIEGFLFLKRDYVECTKNQVQVSSEAPYFVPVEMSEEEKKKVRDYEEDISYLQSAVDMIKDLHRKLKET